MAEGMDHGAVEMIDLALAVEHPAVRGVQPLDAAFPAVDLILGLEPLAVGVPPLVEAGVPLGAVLPEPQGVHESTSSRSTTAPQGYRQGNPPRAAA
ncbi:hypothetical protein D3C84_669330 [compost metagenome]